MDLATNSAVIVVVVVVVVADALDLVLGVGTSCCPVKRLQYRRSIYSTAIFDPPIAAHHL